MSGKDVNRVRGMSGLGDRGRVSIMLAIAFGGLIAVIGVAADIPGQHRAVIYADSVAAEAARAAGQAVDIDHTAAQGEHRIDPDAAVQAADAYLTQAGVDGEVVLDGDLTRITVTVEHIHQPRILGLFGLPPQPVTGIHTAVLVAD